MIGGRVVSGKTGPRAPTDLPQGPPVAHQVAAGSGGVAAAEAEGGDLGAGAGRGKKPRLLRAALR